jgi:hypothetical protein
MPVLDASLDSAAERFIAPLYRGMSEDDFRILCMGSYVRLLDGMAPGISGASPDADLNAGARAYCAEWQRRLSDWGVRVVTDPLRR